MQAIWNIISSTVSSDPVLPVFSGGGRTRALTVVRRASVKGMKLSVDPRDATVRLTLGKRAALKPALGWAADKRAWIEAELARLPQAQPIVPDMVFGLGDVPVRIDWSAALPRAPRLCAPAEAGALPTVGNFAPPMLLRSQEHKVLRVGGPREQLSARVLRFLRSYALDVLETDTRALADTHSITVNQVAVGDPRGRWGSCAASGDIRYSWRLILAPEDVRRATVAHEVAHRVHMNHSRAFHDEVARLYGGNPSSARRWLRAHGTALHWFGREG
ncbi:M48 family metallopeptidase [Sphingomonas sp. SUN039]|uniref:M48 family metallopeptidase n=1 Tax=Sphingomonas sp. SUN039 TaxID=2937787 RepID=UPI002164DA01|nr:M48 family metallopeptidase [Sphingomonas sp. SUN039]UVO55180.1 M48 family metallopeptidase [Sphingomonas sp. SUN039]